MDSPDGMLEQAPRFAERVGAPEAAIGGRRAPVLPAAGHGRSDRPRLRGAVGAARPSEGKFVLLFLLHGQSGGLSPHELAERAGVTRATVTGLLDGLERDGFLRREADEVDRRRVRVLLSAKGKAIATKLFAEHTQWIGGLFEALSPAERKRLGELLGKVWRATDSRAALQEVAR